MNADRFAVADGLLAGAEGRAFPAGAAEVGASTGPRWRAAYGHLTRAEDAPPCTLDTVFDLASLTKVIATTSLWMHLVEAGRLDPDARVVEHLARWTGHDRRDVRITQLLDHSSGLPAHARLFQQCRGRDNFEGAICGMPLAYVPGTMSVYSDLGFLLLGFLIEDLGGATLDTQFDTAARSIREPLTFRPQPGWTARIAPTEFDPWRGRMLRGEVHDENAAAVGGVAGHAGLFGTVGAVGEFARVVLRTFSASTWLGSPALMRRVATRSHVPGSSRALGWDTMRPTSSCGTRMSASAIGHTGFTGTSLWIDWERDVYVVLLTNRVHPTRDNEALVQLRPVFHDAVMREL